MSGQQASLRFESLHIHRMPGIERPGFALDNLSAGINVICGPNASGKTTTARALRALLWPDHPRTPSNAALSGRFTLQDSQWFVEREAGRAHYYQDGQPCDAPLLPPATNADRYNLALHELIRSDNASFARSILQESTGGYDLSRAGEQLGFRAGASQARKLKQELDNARQRLQQAQYSERTLQSQLDRLEELRAQRDAADQARQRLAMLDAAIDRHEKQAALHEAEEQLHSMPAVLEHLVGDEMQQLDQLQQQIDQLERQQQQHERDIQQHLRMMLAADFDDAPPDVLTRTLDQYAQQLQQTERQLQDTQIQLRQANQQRSDEAQRIGNAIDEQRLRVLTVQNAGDLSALVREAQHLHSERSACEQFQRWLGKPAEREHDPQVLRDAVRTLEYWMSAAQSIPTDPRHRIAATVASIAMFAFVAMLGLLVHPAWFTAVALSVMLLAWTWWPRADTDERAAHERTYQTLNMPQPDAWTPEAVHLTLEQLRHEAATLTLEQERRQQWERTEQHRAQLHEKEAQIAERRRQVIAQLGVAPNLDEAQLYILCERIVRWQDANARLVTEKERLKHLNESCQQTLARLNDAFAANGEASVTDAAQAHARVEQFKQRILQYREAQRHLEHAEQSRRQTRQSLAHLKQRQRALFQRVNLRRHQTAQLDELCRQRDAYLQAKQHEAVTRHDYERATAHLVPFADHESLMHEDASALRKQREQAQQQAERWQDLRDQVRELERHAAQARQKHDVEAALALVERCTQQLRDARSTDHDAVAGHQLLCFLQQRITEQHRPQVFHCASQLLTQFTAGRYHLDFNESDPPAFRAIDTANDISRALDELSSGTRVQLLLAVRIAFVQTQESGGALPLMLDELLATSDDDRARAIIQATIEICRTGRQVFYFTAQHDELEKWQSLLNEADDVSCQFIHLDQLRHEQVQPVEPLNLTGAAPGSPPLPAEGHDDHASYGQLLRVPRLDPMRNAGQVHLWYLLHDSHLLYDMLQVPIVTWGQLRTMAQHVGMPRSDPQLDKAYHIGRGLDRLFELWRIGRGKPVTPEVLQACDVITDRFRDELIALARELNGDAEQLIEALDSGRVRYWRKTAELRTYLVDTGHIDAAQPLERERIRWSVLSAIGPDASSDHTIIRHIDWLLAMLDSPVDADALASP